MSKTIKSIILGIFSFILLSNIAYSQIKGITNHKFIKSDYRHHDHSNSKLSPSKNLYLHQAIGELQVSGNANKSPYTVYFIIPIAYREQAPIWLKIDCPQMVNYKYIRLSDDNVVVAATINNTPGTIDLNWTSWVLIKQHDYSEIPESVPIPSISELPDSVKSWLQPTACVQWNDSLVYHISDSIRGTTDDLIVLAERIEDYCYNIPWVFPYSPISFDAYYAMRWGNSCTGHAHAGAAVFRANGIPCRVLMNMPVWFSSYMDMHWIIEYFIPDYGWVKMETSRGLNPYFDADEEVITFACNIEDEFPILYVGNIEAYWFGSDPVFNHMYPNWGGAHKISTHTSMTDSTSKVDRIISITESVFKYNTVFQGIELNNQQSENYNLAMEFQERSFNNAKTGNTDSIIYNLNEALFYFREIAYMPLIEIYFNDFENASGNWTHDGIKDKWDIGIPNIGPENCYSGVKCIGSNLDSVYSNNVNSWILSPSINLSGLSYAHLNFKLWNDVEDHIQSMNPKDKLWVELSTDKGENFFPISTCFGGVNDEPCIPSFGGWNNVVLDLTEYVDSTIQVKFCFTSNNTISKIGSYIDDFGIYGRVYDVTGIDENQSLSSKIECNCFPNPFFDKLEIEYLLPYDDEIQISIYNLFGQKIYSSNISKQTKGKHKLILKTGVYSTGIYHVLINTCNKKRVFKILKL